MTGLGILLFSSAVLLILYRYQAAKHPYPFLTYGYAGGAILLTGEILMFAKVEPVATYFTAIAWTGYILWTDAAVFSLKGKSLLRTYPAEFAWIAFCSIPLWLIFEAYNLRLENWIYVGVPQDWFAQTVGYGWSFATIWPAIFETAALLRGLGRNQSRKPLPAAGSGSSAKIIEKHRADQGAGMAADQTAGSVAALSVLLGAMFLIVPVVLPIRIRPYLFGGVWLGFVFFLEPINFRTGAESLWRDRKQGESSRLVSLLGAGLVCGIFWEFWNFWAEARWVYTFPILPRWRIFAMPLPGYLGFPPFAVECFVLFAFLVPIINRVLEKMGARTRFRREALEL